MNNFLRKTGLLRSVKISLPVLRQNFMTALRASVDAPGIDLFEAFYTGPIRYKGIVTDHGFELQRKRRLMEVTFPVKMHGQVQQIGDRLDVTVTVTGFHPLYLAVLTILIFMYIIVIGVAFESSATLFSFIFICGHMLLMCGIPYFGLWRSVRICAHEIERDLYFLTRQQ